jgi:hypothetical protein
MLPDVKLLGTSEARVIGSDPRIVGAMAGDAGAGDDIAWKKRVSANV